MDSTCGSQLIDVIQTVSRGAVLVLCTLGAILSIYLGWRLYIEAVLSKASAAAEYKGMHLRLVAAGPGVFFALFGMIVLWVLVRGQSSITSETKTEAQRPASIRHFSGQVRADSDWVMAVPVGAMSPAASAGARSADVPCLTASSSKVVTTTTTSHSNNFLGGRVSQKDAREALLFAKRDLQDIQAGTDTRHAEEDALKRAGAIELLESVIAEMDAAKR